MHWELISNFKWLSFNEDLPRFLYTYSELLFLIVAPSFLLSTLPPPTPQFTVDVIDMQKKRYIASDYPVFAIEE